MALAPVELRRAACAAAAVQHGVRGLVSMASLFTCWPVTCEPVVSGAEGPYGLRGSNVRTIRINHPASEGGR